jgi:hypothetical protein
MPIFRKDLVSPLRSTIDEDYFRESTRTYKVYAPVSMDENQVRSGLGFGIFDLHPTDARQILKTISVELREENAGAYESPDDPSDPNNGLACFVWTATLDYGPWDPQEHTATGNPVDQPVTVTIEGQNSEKPVDLDVDDKPILNSAFDPFDPGITRDEARIVLRFRKNFKDFSPAEILFISNKINENPWNTFPEKTLKIEPPRVQPKYSQFSDENYWEVEFDIVYNPDTWTKKVYNQGIRELKTISGVDKQMQITHGSGQPISSAYFLDEDGKALPPPVDDSNIVILEFEIYKTLDFTTIGLPNDLWS